MQFYNQFGYKAAWQLGSVKRRRFPKLIHMSVLQGEAGRQEEHRRRELATFSLCLKSIQSPENQSIQILNTKSRGSVSKWACACTGGYSISPQLMLILQNYHWGHRVILHCSTCQVSVCEEAVSERKLFSSDHNPQSLVKDALSS